MPYVHIQVTDEGVTLDQKKQLIAQTTQMLQSVLDKDPNTTFVVIEEVSMDDWGVGGQTVRELRQQSKSNAN